MDLSTNKEAAGFLTVAVAGNAGYLFIHGLEGQVLTETSESETPISLSSLKTVLDVLKGESSDQERGKPMGSDWERGFNRYSLEAKQGDIKSPSNFENYCKGLFVRSSEDSGGLESARKWCTTYETVREKLGKNLKPNTGAFWKGVYKKIKDSDSRFKSMVSEFKDTGVGNEENRWKNAIYKWCTMGMDASSDAVKEAVEKFCLLQ